MRRLVIGRLVLGRLVLGRLVLGMIGSVGLVSVVACNVDPPEVVAPPAVGHDGQPIIGGTADNVNHATVALAPQGSEAICSGTIIAKNGSTGYVLTAAHCIKGDPHAAGFPANAPPPIAVVLQANDYINCFQGQGNPALCDAVYSVTGVQVHPGFPTSQIPQSQSIVDDFAIITFAGANSGTPVVPPASSDGLGVGQNLELSGYGLTSYPNGFTTQRRHVTTPVSQLFGLQIVFDQTNGKGSCNGDSGGPAYKVIGGQQQVVGVTSFGDQGCTQIGVYGRVQAVYNDFIAPIIGGAVMETCDSCTLSAVNQGGACYGNVQACLGDTSCKALYDCLAVCAANDNTCVQNCANASNQAAIDMFNGIFQCSNCTACSAYCPQTQCGGATTTTTSTGSGNSSGTVTPATSGAGGAGGAGGTDSTGTGSANSGGNGNGSTTVTTCAACAVAPDDGGRGDLAGLALACALGITFASRRRRR